MTRKCSVCGRDEVPVTKKGNLRPHMTPGGQRCHHVHNPSDAIRALWESTAPIAPQLKKKGGRG